MELRAETSIFNDELLKEDIDNAQQTAEAAQAIAGTTAQYFWFLEEIGSVPPGVGTGAHITEKPKDEFLNNPSNGGGNLLARSNGIAIRDGLKELAIFSANQLRIGSLGTGHAIVNTAGMTIYGSDGTIELANIGYGEGQSSSGVLTDAPYFTLGYRVGVIGNYSIAEGYYNTASGFAAHAEGWDTEATYSASHAEGWDTEAHGISSHAEGREAKANGSYSHAEGYQTKAVHDAAHVEGYKAEASGNYSHAEGFDTKATNVASHAEGWQTLASGNCSHASGIGTIARGSYQTVIGRYNNPDDELLFIVGNGYENNKTNALQLDIGGYMTIAGRLTELSDRRLKEHINYLDDDAVEFIHNLKPVHYIKDNEHHIGFYAQDVEAIDKWNCMIGKMNGFKTLCYTELIAPLVKYCQKLEERIEKLERSK